MRGLMFGLAGGLALLFVGQASADHCDYGGGYSVYRSTTFRSYGGYGHGHGAYGHGYGAGYGGFAGHGYAPGYGAGYGGYAPSYGAGYGGFAGHGYGAGYPGGGYHYRSSYGSYSYGPDYCPWGY